MSWIPILITAILALAAMIWLLKLPRVGWELVGAALLVGLAGYALQGHPARPGAPKPPVETAATADEALIGQRRAMGDAFGSDQNWLIIADGMSRNGQFGSAATVLGAALKEQPNDPDLWVALGNALVGHSDGFISPAAQFAFQRAATISPQHPGPPFFMGLALAQTGRLAEARAIWGELATRAPEGAPWKADLDARLAQLDAMLASQAPAAAAPATP